MEGFRCPLRRCRLVRLTLPGQTDQCQVAGSLREPRVVGDVTEELLDRVPLDERVGLDVAVDLGEPDHLPLQPLPEWNLDTRRTRTALLTPEAAAHESPRPDYVVGVPVVFADLREETTDRPRTQRVLPVVVVDRDDVNPLAAVHLRHHHRTHHVAVLVRVLVVVDARLPHGFGRVEGEFRVLQYALCPSSFSFHVTAFISHPGMIRQNGLGHGLSGCKGTSNGSFVSLVKVGVLQSGDFVSTVGSPPGGIGVVVRRVGRFGFRPIRVDVPEQHLDVRQLRTGRGVVDHRPGLVGCHVPRTRLTLGRVEGELGELHDLAGHLVPPQLEEE